MTTSPTSGPLISQLWEEARHRALTGRKSEFGPSELRALAQHFSADEIERLVISKRTLARRRANRENLTQEEADRALRLARISTAADRVFGNPEKAARWLRKPASKFNGQPPIALLDNEAGAHAVEELLAQIDHGMFA